MKFRKAVKHGAIWPSVLALSAIAFWFDFNRGSDAKAARSKASATGSRAGNVNSKSWSLFRGDPQFTGVANAVLPDRPKLQWKVEVGDGPIVATAAIVDGVIYVASLDGGVRALKLANGEKIWNFPSKIGFNASPAVRDGLVYAGDSDGVLFCLDAKSGKEKWKLVTEGPIDNSVNFYKDNVLVGSQDACLYCLNAKSGKLVWKYTAEDQIRCAPTVVANRAFLAGCDGNLHVVDLDKGKAVDTVEIDGPTGSTPAAHGSIVYFGTEGGTFFAIDWKLAKVVWKFRDPKRQLAFRSSAAVNKSIVIFGGRTKRLYGLQPKDGTKLWEFPIRQRIDSSPVIVSGRAFFGASDGRIYAVKLENGEKAWEFETGGEVTASPAIADGRMVIGNDDGVLFCFGK